MRVTMCAEYPYPDVPMVDCGECDKQFFETDCEWDDDRKCWICPECNKKLDPGPAPDKPHELYPKPENWKGR